MSFDGLKLLELNLKECKIDESGVYKYIQIKCTNKTNNESKIIIRGTGYFSFHKDIFNDFMVDIKTSKNKELIEDCEFNCIGGGSIDFKPKYIFIYGYSNIFGQANHEKTVEIIKKYYPNYTVDYSNSGC